jgi:transcriptional regulator with XRE-family HTH domain
MPCRLDLLASVREALGITQDELAKASNQSLATIVSAERGSTLDDDAAAQIAAALNTTLELLGQADL